MSASVLSTLPASILSVKTFSLAEIERATEKFSSRRILGEGGFGRVYHGVTEDGSDVAVKLLTRDSHNGDREFISEVEMLSRLHHRNLVKLIGICIQDHVRCLIYELVPNGSVESHLHGIFLFSSFFSFLFSLTLWIKLFKSPYYLFSFSQSIAFPSLDIRTTSLM